MDKGNPTVLNLLRYHICDETTLDAAIAGDGSARQQIYQDLPFVNFLDFQNGIEILFEPIPDFLELLGVGFINLNELGEPILA